ncbi:MAG: S1C family serine protease [Eubacteriales bacterium]|jgi:serine protease Do
MRFYDENDNQYTQDNNDNFQQESGPYQQNSNQSYHYSWNQQDPIYPNDNKGKGRKILKIFAGAFALVFGISVISLAAYGGFTMLNDLSSRNDPAQDQQQQVNENAPQLSITDIEDYQKINEPEIREGEPMTEVQAIAKVSPSVVGVVSTIVTRTGFTGTSTGSGIIMTEDGYIITNAHVVSGATDVTVTFADGSNEIATIVGSDTKSDLAVLKINRTGLTAAEFGNSDNLQVGERVVAIGNPLGLELFGTAVDGMISAVDRDVTIDDRVMTLLQTSAPINEGNSGGPLVNLYGQVIGINSAKISGTGVEGISFAIPINSAKEVIDSLLQYGYVKDRPMLGISGSDMSEREALIYDIPQGVWVEEVTPGSGAEKAGISSGDVIYKVNDVIIHNMSELNAQKEKYKAGDEIKLTIYRNGKTFDVMVELMEETPEMTATP